MTPARHAAAFNEQHALSTLPPEASRPDSGTTPVRVESGRDRRT